MGFEPMNTGFADQRVSHFAIGALHPGSGWSQERNSLYPTRLAPLFRLGGCAEVRLHCLVAREDLVSLVV